MLKRSTLQHLRFQFSWHLAPVFLFAVSESVRQLQGPVPASVWWLFLILHFLVYPASNGFNSFYDKDEKSIGEIEHPLPVTTELWWVSLALDAIALLLALYLGWPLFIFILLYGAISKAYSHPAIRLKARPVLGWVTIALFQGAMIYLMVRLAALGSLDYALDWKGAVVSTLLVGSGYPLTQVYQHEEDARRGDRTLSMLLGVRGTFVFSGVCFAFTHFALLAFFWGRWGDWLWLELALAPTAIYFGRLAARSWRDPACANFRSIRRLSRLGATCFNLAFLGLWGFHEFQIEKDAGGIAHADKEKILNLHCEVRQL